MPWTGPPEAPLSTRVAALAPAMQRSERLVAEAITADLPAAVECTAQQLAERIGVGRASVVRTARTLGYEGYPQMRVALARELSFDEGAEAEPAGEAGSADAVRAAVLRFSRTLPRVASALSPDAVDTVVAALDEAPRVVIAASGLSVPLALGAAMRLSAADRPAEFLPDALSQQIAARHLDSRSVCLVISGSGANPASLDVAGEARRAGARVLALTSFAHAPLVEVAEAALVVPTMHDSFSDELRLTSRTAMTLVLEAVVELLIVRRGERGARARDSVLSLLGERLTE
ncbi:MurR/RpiR family transcriptional regulator [Brachybacterium saurashtrense]|uniref:MurR/RpiR family transcriptional regulator n=1 Tax=Brachybacterium saurashtrense TaxID=556288 RepID=A0A345YPN8_9MICO|nr:MurR/RpiR family transcriptional regulator [Brachybacterium saurashtrense]AXK45890.1 MurR/RpiR family transcriptional regulator [Brachybacterium saurashtrense]RRR24909.1 MurR/RpiR family transcriptional regulator [Brachybacterium saurashtrense]